MKTFCGAASGLLAILFVLWLVMEALYPSPAYQKTINPAWSCWCYSALNHGYTDRCSLCPAK